METSLAPFKQVLRKLCMFKPLQSRESLLNHNCPRRCPGTTPHSNCHISQLIPPIQMFLNILELAHHKLYIAHGLTLVTPSLRGWEAFLTSTALTNTRITWASYHWCYKSWVSLQGPPCTHGVLGTPHGEVRNSFQ